jgi:hypothetical protein
MEDAFDAFDLALVPALDPSILEMLAGHGDSRVRATVASNPNTGMEVLELLSVDTEASVRAAAFLTSRIPAGPAESDESPIVRAVAAQLTEDPSGFAQDADASVRAAAVTNERCTVEVLRVALSDEDESVVAAATTAAEKAGLFTAPPEPLSEAAQHALCVSDEVSDRSEAAKRGDLCVADEVLLTGDSDSRVQRLCILNGTSPERFDSVAIPVLRELRTSSWSDRLSDLSTSVEASALAVELSSNFEGSLAELAAVSNALA